MAETLGASVEIYEMSCEPEPECVWEELETADDDVIANYLRTDNTVTLKTDDGGLFLVHKSRLAFRSATWAHCFAATETGTEPLPFEASSEITRLLLMLVYGESSSAEILQDKPVKLLLEAVAICHKYEMRHLQRELLEPRLTVPELMGTEELLQLYGDACRWQLTDFAGLVADSLAKDMKESRSLLRTSSTWAGFKAEDVAAVANLALKKLKQKGDKIFHELQAAKHAISAMDDVDTECDYLRDELASVRAELSTERQAKRARFW